MQFRNQTLKILHIEDSVADQSLARLSLKRGQLPCTLTAVDSLQEVRNALETQDFDLILADYHLPGFTALDVWDLVRTRSDAPPFVLLSGAIGESAAVDIMRLGISDYLLKDQINGLPHVIKRAMEVHEARQARRRAALQLAESEKRLAELTEVASSLAHELNQPLMAITRLNNCNGVWRSPKKKKPMAERKKICRLLSRVEMPGPTA